MNDAEAPPMRMKPLALLICAMGGEGGGVLTGWIVAAARAQGLAVQATSVPGVAQRTGGTTYYIEFAQRDAQGRSPVFALTPVPGQIDYVVASELVEGSRAARQGYATPDRTEFVSSTHRVFLIQEKMAMGDGRLDPVDLEAAVRTRSKRATFLDMEKLATTAGVPISPVLLGALAGATSLPIARQHFETAIRDGGIAVEKNVAAFKAAYEAAQTAGKPVVSAPPLKPSDFMMEPEAPAHPQAQSYPASARDTIARGLERLIAYQDKAYADLYSSRLAPFAKGDPELLREVARHLALRMSYEDVIRVAQAKAAPERYQRIRGEVGAANAEPIEVQDFFKPGVRETADLLPPWLARWLLRRAEKNPRLQKFHIGMKVRTTTVSGYMRVWTLAKLRRWRRGTYRYQVEQAAIEGWLGLVARAVERGDTQLGLEIAELARLIKGYGDTHARGTANYERIVSVLVEPALSGKLAGDTAARIRAARAAALTDPEGTALASALSGSAVV